MRRCGGDPRQGAFSLIEVLVALMILSVGATSILALFAAAASTHKRSVDRTRAALVAERIVAEAQSVYVPGTSAEDLRSALYARLPETIDGYSWDIETVRPGEEGRRKKSSLARMARTTAAKAQKAAAKPGMPAKAPSRASAPSEGSGGWSEDELLMRISVAWSQGGRLITEEYVTLILPHAAAPEGKKR